MNIDHREFTRTTKHIALIIEGEEYDGVDLYNLLNALHEGELIYLTSGRVAKMLENLQIISSRGNSYIAATKGPNFDSFYNSIVGKYNFDDYEEYT
jgi:hypothetical protein